MRSARVWYWLAFSYLVATTIFNIASQWHSLPQAPHFIQASVTANLSLKIIAIALLLTGKRKFSIYLLSASFCIGLSATLWDYLSFGGWSELPYEQKFGRVFGFVISLAIIGYLVALEKWPLARSN